MTSVTQKATPNTVSLEKIKWKIVGQSKQGEMADIVVE